jgi:hypothetical protein
VLKFGTQSSQPTWGLRAFNPQAAGSIPAPVIEVTQGTLGSPCLGRLSEQP